MVRHTSWPKCKPGHWQLKNSQTDSSHLGLALLTTPYSPLKSGQVRSLVNQVTIMLRIPFYKYSANHLEVAFGTVASTSPQIQLARHAIHKTYSLTQAASDMGLTEYTGHCIKRGSTTIFGPEPRLNTKTSTSKSVGP